MCNADHEYVIRPIIFMQITTRNIFRSASLSRDNYAGAINKAATLKVQIMRVSILSAVDVPRKLQPAVFSCLTQPSQLFLLVTILSYSL